MLKKIVKNIVGMGSIIAIAMLANAAAAKPLVDIKPLIKAGTAMLANLDTAVTSDAPLNTISVTVIDGKYTGAKLIGKLDKSNQSIIHFSSMQFKEKGMNPKRIDAYAIDFDAARIVLITDPDFDELKPKAIAMAKSLLSSYSVAHKLKLGSGTDIGILFMSNVG